MEKIKKEHKEKIMEIIGKAGSEEYKTSWNEKGIPISKKKSNIKKGKQNRAAGARFELKVRNELEGQGWIMDKWTNNVDLQENKLVKAKRKYNPFKKMLIIGTGFPDFIAFKKTSKKNYEIIGVEVKIKGVLSRTEKEKCVWYLTNNIFSKILIAKAVKEGRKINVGYLDFKKKFHKFFK